MANVSLYKGTSYGGTINVIEYTSWVPQKPLLVLAKDTIVDFQAVADPGYKFVAWVGHMLVSNPQITTRYWTADNRIRGDTPTLKLKISRDTIVSALFISDEQPSMLTLNFVREVPDPTPTEPDRTFPTAEVIDFGVIDKVTRRLNTTVKQIPIITGDMASPFAMDSSVNQVIDVKYSRITPHDADDVSEDSRKWSNRWWWAFFRESMNRWQAQSDGWRLCYAPHPDYKELYPLLEYNVYLHSATYNFRGTDYIAENVIFNVGMMNIQYSQPQRVTIYYWSDVWRTASDRRRGLSEPNTFPLNIPVTARSLPDAWTDHGGQKVFIGWLRVLGVYQKWGDLTASTPSINDRAILTDIDPLNPTIPRGIYKWNGTTWIREDANDSNGNPLYNFSGITSSLVFPGDIMYLNETMLRNNAINFFAIWATPIFRWSSIGQPTNTEITINTGLSGVIRAIAFVQGGGGGGAKAGTREQSTQGPTTGTTYFTPYHYGGGGGGGGARAERWDIPVTGSNPSFKVFVGSGGSGANPIGGNGNASWFEHGLYRVTANGGGGGVFEVGGEPGRTGTGTANIKPGERGSNGSRIGTFAIIWTGGGGGGAGVSTQENGFNITSSGGSGGATAGCWNFIIPEACPGGPGSNGGGGGGGGKASGGGKVGGNGGAGYVAILGFG